MNMYACRAFSERNRWLTWDDNVVPYEGHSACSTLEQWHNSRGRISRRGGRAVDCTGLENRQAERPREFESHPLRHSCFALTRFAGFGRALWAKQDALRSFSEGRAITVVLRLIASFSAQGQRYVGMTT